MDVRNRADGELSDVSAAEYLLIYKSPVRKRKWLHDRLSLSN